MASTAKTSLTVMDAAVSISGETIDFMPGLVALDGNGGSEEESFRALRTHLMARHVEEGRRALAVCGATGHVGSTYIAANLAVALSQIGVKTLLIDANLRSPGIDKLFVPHRPIGGLTQCLENSSSGFSEYILPEVLPNLSVMFSGGSPSNAQELLALTRFGDLLNFCMRDYDMTVLDTPQANTCSDSIRISSVVGYSVVVARRNLSLVSDIRTLIDQLRSARARVVGTIMTEI